MIRRVLALVLALAGCAHAELPPNLRGPYGERSISSDTRVVLVAGGDDVANFAAEVAAQRRIWRAAGVAPEQIACYWAKPTTRAYRKDRRQYQHLAGTMHACGPASAKRVLADLAALADDPPPWLYVYITGHGVPTLASPQIAAVLPPDERKLLLSPALALDADAGLRVQHVDALLQAHREGRPDDELLVTPQTLRDALARVPASTRKIIVLQGCFSGSFIASANSLRDLPSTIVLTAAAADRPSFGCGSGTRTTFWGGALERELERIVHRGNTPDVLDWKSIYESVAARVTKLERALGQKPSNPQYLDTTLLIPQ